jgi:hypothetical protein
MDLVALLETAPSLFPLYFLTLRLENAKRATLSGGPFQEKNRR